jgi:D-alanyl-D-alanine carboxypeptidase
MSAVARAARAPYKGAMRARVALLTTLILAVLAVAPQVAHALPPGLVTKRSPYDVTQTLDRLEDLLKKNGFTIVARIDLRPIAKEGGETIGAAQSLIASFPEFDGRLLKSERAMGLDLPIRILASEDTSGRVTLIYPAPDRLAQRYNVTNQPVAVQKMVQLLDQLTDQALKP